MTPFSDLYIKNKSMVTEMYRTVKMPIKPRSEQRRAIDRFIELNRYIYNASITAINLYYESNHKLPSEFEMNRLVTKIRDTCPMFKESWKQKNRTGEPMR